MVFPTVIEVQAVASGAKESAKTPRDNEQNNFFMLSTPFLKSLKLEWGLLVVVPRPELISLWHFSLIEELLCVINHKGGHSNDLSTLFFVN